MKAILVIDMPEACEKLIQGLDAMEKMKAVEVKVVRRTE